jgi:hypothetical protein
VVVCDNEIYSSSDGKLIKRIVDENISSLVVLHDERVIFGILEKNVRIDLYAPGSGNVY